MGVEVDVEPVSVLEEETEEFSEAKNDGKTISEAVDASVVLVERAVMPDNHALGSSLPIAHTDHLCLPPPAQVNSLALQQKPLQGMQLLTHILCVSRTRLVALVIWDNVINRWERVTAPTEFALRDSEIPAKSPAAVIAIAD
jgi:hypothetical protein